MTTAATKRSRRRLLRPLLYGVVLAAVALWVTGRPRPPAVAVEFAGCGEFLRDGPVCEIVEGSTPPGPLRLRIHPLDGTRWQLLVVGGGQTLPVPADQALSVQVPQDTKAIELEALLPARPVVWRLRLVRHRLSQWLIDDPPAAPAQRDAFVCALHGRLANAPPELRGAVLRRLARLSPGEQRESLFRQEMAAHRAAGQLLGEVWAGAAVAGSAIQEHRFQDARGILDDLTGRLPMAAPVDAQTVLAITFERGVLARDVGDLRTALLEGSAAADLAERLDFPAPWPNSTGQEKALVLQDLGRWPEAVDIYQRLLKAQEAVATAQPSRPLQGARAECQQKGTSLSNYGWSLLMQREAQGAGAKGAAADAFPLDLLLQAKKLFDSESCNDDTLRLDVRISLALAELQQGDRAGARQDLAAGDRLAAEMARRSPSTTPAALSNRSGPDLTAAAMKPEQRLWRYEIEARLALDEGRTSEALGLYNRLQQLAESTFSPAGRWLAAYGQARAYRKLGDIDAALAAYARASALIDEQSLDIPIFEGREMFVALREVGTRSYLDLLVTRGRAADAFAVARRGRSRVLRQFERSDRLAGLSAEDRAQWQQRLSTYRQLRDDLDRKAEGDWQLAADELRRARADRVSSSRAMQEALDSAFTVLDKGGDKAAQLRRRVSLQSGAPAGPAGPSDLVPSGPGGLAPPGPGEVVLMYYDLGAGRWVGFAAAGAAVNMKEFHLPPGALPPPDELSPLLLAPFGREIQQARQVRVLLFGTLKAVDFQALPFAGDILLAARPVVYGLDSRVPLAAPRQRTGPWRALVLGDPRGDLPEARGEAQAVGRALTSRDTRWSAEILRGETDKSTLLDGRLGRCDLFHYAGHAASATAGSWESMLLLAHDSRLTLADLLALPRSPAWVVLAGCDTGQQPVGTPFEVPSLAHAFLLAGARGVIAAMRSIDDREAREFFAELYQDWRGEPDLAARLRSTQLRLRASHPEVVKSFRLFEP